MRHTHTPYKDKKKERTQNKNQKTRVDLTPPRNHCLLRFLHIYSLFITTNMKDAIAKSHLCFWIRIDTQIAVSQILISPCYPAIILFPLSLSLPNSLCTLLFNSIQNFLISASGADTCPPLSWAHSFMSLWCLCFLESKCIYGSWCFWCTSSKLRRENAVAFKSR